MRGLLYKAKKERMVGVSPSRRLVAFLDDVAGAIKLW